MCSGPLPSNVSGTAANGTNFFPALRAMNISHNSFSGSLPASFGQSGVFNLKPLQVRCLPFCFWAHFYKILSLTSYACMSKLCVVLSNYSMSSQSLPRALPGACSCMLDYERF